MGKRSPVTVRMSSTPLSTIAMSTVVLGELLYGALRSNKPVANWNDVIAFANQFVMLSFDNVAAEVYARIRATLTTAGNTIGPNDLLIAATALSNGLTLVTHNTTEFSRVPGLLMEDWQLP